MCASLFGGRSDPVSFFAGINVQTAKKSSVCCAESKVWREYYNSVKISRSWPLRFLRASIFAPLYLDRTILWLHAVRATMYRSAVQRFCSVTQFVLRVWRRPDPNNVRRLAFSKNNSFSGVRSNRVMVCASQTLSRKPSAVCGLNTNGIPGFPKVKASTITTMWYSPFPVYCPNCCCKAMYSAPFISSSVASREKGPLTMSSP